MLGKTLPVGGGRKEKEENKGSKERFALLWAKAICKSKGFVWRNNFLNFKQPPTEQPPNLTTKIPSPPKPKYQAPKPKPQKPPVLRSLQRPECSQDLPPEDFAGNIFMKRFLSSMFDYITSKQERYLRLSIEGTGRFRIVELEAAVSCMSANRGVFRTCPIVNSQMSHNQNRFG